MNQDQLLKNTELLSRIRDALSDTTVFRTASGDSMFENVIIHNLHHDKATEIVEALGQAQLLNDEQVGIS